MNNRIKTIDILRAFAIIFMIPFHIYIYWPAYELDLYGVIIFFLGSLPGPFFTIISGVSFFIFINNKREKNNSKKEIFFDVLKRALFIFVLSTVLQLLFGFILKNNFSYLIYWSLFQLISISMLIFFVLPFVKKNFRFLAYICLYIMIFFIYSMNSLVQIQIIWILLFGGVFPFFPWASFFVFGLFIGDLIINYSEIFQKVFLKLFLIGGIVIIIIWLYWLHNLSFQYVSLFFIGYGIFFIFLSTFYYLIELKEINFFLIKKLVHWGKFSFSIYYIHFIAIILGILIFPLIIHEIYSYGFNFYHYIIFTLIFFVSIDIFLNIWKKFNYILGIEWFINKISEKSLFIKN